MCSRPGGVDDHDVGPVAPRGGDRVEGDRSRIGVRGTLDEPDAGALGPHLELLDPGGAEGVGRADHDGLAELLAEVPRQLADRRRLAGAVDAGDEDHRRLRGEVDPVLAGASDLGEQLGQTRRERLSPGYPALGGLALELSDDLRGRRRADVGVDQRLLEPLPRLVAQILEQRRLDLAGERLAGLAQVLAQPAEHPAAPLLSLGRGFRDRVPRGRAIDDEQVPPIAGHG